MKYDKYVVVSSNVCRIYVNYIDTRERCVSLLKVASKISPSEVTRNKIRRIMRLPGTRMITWINFNEKLINIKFYYPTVHQQVSLLGSR